MSEDTLITAAGEENDGTDGDGDGEEKYPGDKEEKEGEGEDGTTIPKDDDSGEWN